MSDKMIKFPISYSQRRKNIMGPLAVECQVSGRYLQFHENSAMVDSSEFITVDVMTMPDSDQRTRKLCELIITREELLEALKHITPSK